MRTILIALIICCLIASLSAQNIGIDIGTNGKTWLKITDAENNQYKFDYSTSIDIHGFLEHQGDGHMKRYEINYAKYDLIGVNNDFPYEYDKTLNYIALHEYYGITFIKQKRIQVPIFGGIGFSYLHGEPMNAIGLMLVAKFQPKIYITNTLGIYGGVSYDTGYFFKFEEKDEEIYETTNDTNYKYSRSYFSKYHFDIGITYTLPY